MTLYGIWFTTPAGYSGWVLDDRKGKGYNAFETDSEHAAKIKLAKCKANSDYASFKIKEKQ